MAEILEGVTDTISGMSSKKGMKKYLPFILAGGLFGVVMFLKKKNSSSEVETTSYVDDTGIGGNVGGLNTDYVNEAISNNNEAIESAFETMNERLTSYEQNLSKDLSKSFSELAENDKSVYSVISSLTTDMNNLRNKVDSTVSPTPVVTPSKDTPISKTATNGVFASQTFVDFSVTDKAKLDANGKAYNDNKAKQAEALKAGNTKLAESFEKKAIQNHVDSEKIRENYGFSGGKDGSEYIKK